MSGDLEITVRASRIGLALTCPASTVTRRDDGSEVVHVSEPNEPALVGDAVHMVLAEIVRDGEVRTPVEQFLERVGLGYEHREDVVWLASHGAWRWKQRRDGFPSPIVETPAQRRHGRLTITGTLDVGQLTGDPVRVLDWKSGRRRTNARPQGRGYAALIMPLAFEARSCEISIEWLRYDSDVEVITREEVDAWIAHVERRLVDGAGTYNPGDHCGDCTRRHDCPAYHAWAEPKMLSIDGEVVDIEADAPPGELAATIQARRGLLIMFEKRIAEEKAKLTRMVQAAGGSLPLTEETELAISQPQQLEIHPGEAWATIVNALGKDYDALARTIKFRLGALETEIKARAERGQKKATWEDFVRRLEDSGVAHREEQSPRLIERRRRKDTA